MAQKPEEIISYFSSLPTLSTIEIPADKLIHAFEGNKRFPESLLQKFISVNKKSLSFLGIDASISQIGYKLKLILSTSRFTGSAPLISPADGKKFSDFNVTGRYGEELGELLSLIDDSITPEYSESLTLFTNSSHKPPIYIECCKFLDKYLEARRFRWTKFDSEMRIQRHPNGGTLWDKYAVDTATDPFSKLSFPNRCNILEVNHIEWQQINYVLGIAISHLELYKTPVKARLSYLDKISFLKRILMDSPKRKTNVLQGRMSDPKVIKELKEIGNLILNSETNLKLAWRVDYADFFEKYVQYLVSAVAKRKGGTFYPNIHFPIVGKKPKWGLAYLEPDMVLKRGDSKVIIDAKYKSHMYNWNDYSDDLKDSFRHDLHQIMAYSSFVNTGEKSILLIYPFFSFVQHRMTAQSPLDSTVVNITLVGIPISKKEVVNVEAKLSELIKL